MAPHNLTAEQWGELCSLFFGEGKTIKQVADAFGLDASDTALRSRLLDTAASGVLKRSAFRRSDRHAAVTALIGAGVARRGGDKSENPNRRSADLNADYWHWLDGYLLQSQGATNAPTT